MVGGKFAYGAFGELDDAPIHCPHVEQPIHYAETETVFLREDGSTLHVLKQTEVKSVKGLSPASDSSGMDDAGKWA